MRVATGLAAWVGAMVAAMVGAVPAAAAQPIEGVGSSLAAPLYAGWGEAATTATGVALGYQASGSEAGQGRIIDRTADFAVSDMALAPARLEATRLLQFPVTLAAIVPIVHLPGVADARLRLTGELLAGIYLGTITRWNDARLVEANRGLELPDIAIVPVSRSDGSEATLAFTSYLSAVSRPWREKVGAALGVSWPAARGAAGSDGLAAAVQQARGGIGYVESGYLSHHRLTTVQLRDKSGGYVAADGRSYAAAAAAADWAHAQGYAANLIDLAGPGAWPIMSASFVLLPRNPADAGRSAGVLNFFDWAFRSGGPIAAAFGAVLVPANVEDSIRAAWHAEIRHPDG